MEMAQVTDAHRKLERLTGRWTGPEKMHPAPWDPTGGPATGNVDNRTALDGFAVVQDYFQERGGAISFRGHGVMYHDATRQDYVMDWLDSMGGPRSEFRGQFEGDVLKLTSNGPMGLCRCSFDLAKPGAYAFLMEVSPDGQQWFPAMEGSYTKS